ncbi:M16 family metallopeptidase [Keratinibaculum paraultunense]|uniref:M16 family metallopeptidase n=1 Tax=Keratinibaculum paraultunense TaxID=1278232 RepID=UPI00192BE458|nr:pitrilysin family protein [Keratinibaculum paraultunense]QQY79718.1 insulinase family protein [Keratinibaculum paraultunense]
MNEVLSFYLENGLQVLLHKIPNIKMIATGMWIKQGSKNENDDVNGISHFTEHMVFNRNNRYNKDVGKNFQKLNDFGVTYNATTTKEYTYYHFKGLKESLEICLNTIKSIIVNNNKFDKEVFVNERKVIYQEASSYYASFNQIVECINQAIYGNYSIGRPILGTLDNINDIKLEDVEKLVSNTYTPENSILILIGDINYDESTKLIKSIFGDWEDTSTIKVNESIVDTPGVYYKKTSNTPNSVLSLGFKVKNDSIEDVLISKLLVKILADPIMSQRITHEIRQKRGIAYNVGGFVTEYENFSTLAISVVCKHEDVTEATNVIIEEIIRLLENGINEEEFNRSKMSLITEKNLDFNNISKKLIYFGKYASYNQLYFLENTIRKIKKIQLEDVIKRSRSILRYNNLGLAMIGNTDIEAVVDTLEKIN